MMKRYQNKYLENMKAMTMTKADNPPPDKMTANLSRLRINESTLQNSQDNNARVMRRPLHAKPGAERAQK